MQGQGELATEISRDFTAAAFDMSRREGAERAGWDNLPESVFACSLAAAGEVGPVIRSGLTLVAAMDRARDAIRLWDCAVALHTAIRWALIPAEVGLDYGQSAALVHGRLLLTTRTVEQGQTIVREKIWERVRAAP